MAFTTMQFNDLRGILFLMLMTIPSIATTNIDCNGKPFHCMNTTHFMICVDLGGGVSSTIDSFIIPCPAPTECHNTNRFECEFPAATTQPPINEASGITTDQTITTTVQAIESTVQSVPEIVTTIPFEDFYNTVSTTTLSASELSTPNPTFITDSTTIDVFDNINVSTSGSHADLEVGGRNTDVLNITSIPDVFSETTVSTVKTDSAVRNTTENVITFTQIDNNINTINETTTLNPDVEIIMTEQNKLPTFTTTEEVNLITESITEANVNYISENQLVTGSINVSSSIQDQAVNTTESTRNDTLVDNNAVSVTEITLDQSFITNDQGQLRTDTTKETQATSTNPTENFLINVENTTRTLIDVPKEPKSATTQKPQIYKTTEALVSSSITIPSDLSIATESTLLVEPSTLIESKVPVNQEKQNSSLATGTIDRTLRPIFKTEIEMSTQNTTANNSRTETTTSNIDVIITDSDVITGHTSELHNAITSSTAPTIDTTLITETTITPDAFYSIKNTSVNTTSEVNATTDKVTTYGKNNNIVGKMSTISVPLTDSSILTTDETIVGTDSTKSLIVKNEKVIPSLETNIKTTLVTTESILEFDPTITEPATSESYFNSITNIDAQPSTLDPALHQLDVFNKPDSDTNVSKSQHNILSNKNYNADKQDIRTTTVITEPTITITEKNIDSNDVNTILQLVQDNFITTQREDGTSKIKTTQITESLNSVSDSNTILEPSVTSLPVISTESLLYKEARKSEKTNKDQVVIVSTSDSDNQLNNQIGKKIDSITNVGPDLPTETTIQYYDMTESNRKEDHITDVNITDILNESTTYFSTDKITSEIRENKLIGHETVTTAQNEEAKTNLQERVETNTLQKTATGTTVYSLTAAEDGKLIGTKSTIFENEQNKIKPTEVVTKLSENQLTEAATETIFELNPTATDSAVSESNFLFESNVNVKIPKPLLTKAIDTNNKQDLHGPDPGSEKSNNLEPKAYETPTVSMTEPQTQLEEIDTQQQKVTNTTSSISSGTEQSNSISELSVTESKRNFIDFDAQSQTVSPDYILQLTTSSVLETTKYISSASKVLESRDATKSTIENSSDFAKIKSDNIKYSLGDLITRSFPTIPSVSISGNLDNKVHEQAQTPQNQIVPIVNLSEANPNIKLSESPTTLQTPMEQITMDSKFLRENNIENIKENTQNKALNNKDTVANSVSNPVPINSIGLSFRKEDVNRPTKQETSTSILEKVVINSTPSNETVIQVPDEIQGTPDNTTYSEIDHEVQPDALLESANMNNDVITGTKNNGPTLTKLSTQGDFSAQNAYNDKQVIIKQEDPHTEESVLQEINNKVINEGKTTDIINHTSTINSSTVTGKVIPAEFGAGSNIISKNLGGLNNKTSIENSSNLVENNTSALVGKNYNQNFTVGNNTNLYEAGTVQTRNKLGHSIVGLVLPVPTQTSDILKIVPITTDKTSTPATHIFISEKDQARSSVAVLTVTHTLKPLQIVGNDKTASKVTQTDKNNGTENTHSSFVSSNDGQSYGKKEKETRVKSLAERDVSATQVESKSINSQKLNNNAGEAVNLAPFDLLSSAKSGGFEEKNNKPATEKPDDEEIIASGNEEENSKINRERSLTTLSSESVSVTTESVEGENNENYDNIAQVNSKYETLTSKPTIEISTRPTQVDNSKNIQQLPIVSEVSTQSTVRSTSQRLSLENNTPLPATTQAIANNFVCKFNQRGRFADNHDCRKFYICHGRPQPLAGICPVYTVFSELRKQCTKNLSHCVRNNQFQCVSEGRFSDFLNDNIYYICAKNKLGTFIRFKLRCQNGYHLNKTSVRCVLNTETSQSISSDISKSNSEQSAALKMEVKSKDSSKKKFECEEEGKFADPDDCRVYYVCKEKSKSRLLRKKKKCDSDEYFHKDKKKCVDAESYECK